MRNIQLLLTIILGLTSQLVFANLQPTSQIKSGIFDVLNFQEVVEVNLEMDVNGIISNRRNTEKHPATLSFTDVNGTEQIWNIKVNLRGKFRRTKCAEMPPLKLNFKKADLKAKGLGKFDDLKLVTHCVEDEEEAKTLILKEYLAYKLFNEISDESFRVQLLKINYVDLETKEQKQHFGILIEDTAQMRNRIAAEKIEPRVNLSADKFYTKSLKKVALFQYMIGNFDWDVRAIRNIKIVKRGDKLLAIPYDFDFSFFVDAPYASTGSDFQITSKTDRIYLGFEEDLKDMEEVKLFFISKKRDLYQTIKDFKLLKMGTRKRMIKYLDSFYKSIDDIKPMPKKKVVVN